ncbi:hypothetical protein N9193_00765 [Pseudomonadales bacterium]|nr:hypothetical protein [Pseudomonadales bacterium]
MYFLNGWGLTESIFFYYIGLYYGLRAKRKKRNGIEFMTDRVKRIAPIYWFLTGLFFLISIITLSIVDGFPAGISWMTSSFLFIFQPVMGVEPVFYVGWTLEYEMFCYVIFAVSIALINSLPSYLLVLIMLISLHVFFGVSLLVLEFFIGMLIGYFYLRLSIKEELGILSRYLV